MIMRFSECFDEGLGWAEELAERKVTYLEELLLGGRYVGDQCWPTDAENGSTGETSQKRDSKRQVEGSEHTRSQHLDPRASAGHRHGRMAIQFVFRDR
jgi:hypothetical protein